MDHLTSASVLVHLLNLTKGMEFTSLLGTANLMPVAENKNLN